MSKQDSDATMDNEAQTGAIRKKMTTFFDNVLTKHSLKHIRHLRIDPSLGTLRFSSGCSTQLCKGMCCSAGVFLDLADKEKILRHADLIKKHLDPDQQRDETRWFTHDIEDDMDFPSGRCDSTTVHQNGCVFLNGKGLCALQITAMAEGMDKFALKPFFCVAFPLVIDEHTLTLDNPDFVSKKACCVPASDGTMHVFDVYREEFAFMLGDEGFREIKTLFAKTV